MNTKNKKIKIKIKKLNNIRDLGNLEDSDGKRIKKGLLFRSSVLDKINEKGKKKLENRFRIHHIFDLRSDEEVVKRPDRFFSSITLSHTPLLSTEDNPYLNRKNRLSFLKQKMKLGGMNVYLCSCYRKLISSELAIKGYKEIFKQLLVNDNEPILYHCTQGKDRTGMTTAVILMALGFDKDTIINDYLSYNKQFKVKNKLIFIFSGLVLFNYHIARNIMYSIKACPEFIQSAFDELENKYQNINNYLCNVIGLTEENLDTLRKRYLEQN